MKEVIDKEVEIKEVSIQEQIKDEDLNEVSSPEIYQAEWKAYFRWCDNKIINPLFRTSAQAYLVV